MSVEAGRQYRASHHSFDGLLPTYRRLSLLSGAQRPRDSRPKSSSAGVGYTNGRLFEAFFAGRTPFSWRSLKNLKNLKDSERFWKIIWALSFKSFRLRSGDFIRCDGRPLLLAVDVARIQLEASHGWRSWCCGEASKDATSCGARNAGWAAEACLLVRLLLQRSHVLSVPGTSSNAEESGICPMGGTRKGSHFVSRARYVRQRCTGDSQKDGLRNDEWSRARWEREWNMWSR